MRVAIAAAITSRPAHDGYSRARLPLPAEIIRQAHGAGRVGGRSFAENLLADRAMPQLANPTELAADVAKRLIHAEGRGCVVSEK